MQTDRYQDSNPTKSQTAENNIIVVLNETKRCPNFRSLYFRRPPRTSSPLVHRPPVVSPCCLLNQMPLYLPQQNKSVGGNSYNSYEIQLQKFITKVNNGKSKGLHNT